MTNTERNTVLAALFGADGYEAALECPQGHDAYMAVEHGDYDDHDDWIPDPHYGIGTLCLTCITLDYGYSRALRLRKDHKKDLNWHPEWRIKGVPKDFTAPGVLEPFVAHLGYSWIHTAIPKSKDTSVKHLVEVYLGVSFSASFFTLRFGKLVPDGLGIGEAYETALGEAVLSAQASLGR